MSGDSVAAFYGDYSLYWHGIIMGAAVLLGILAALFMRSFQRERVNDVLYAAVFSVPLGLMGARAFYCWHGADRHVDIHQLTDLDTYLEGGFGLYGALGAGALAMVLVCLIMNINILKLADACAPGVALGICTGRLAAQFSTTDRGNAVAAKWLQRAPFSTWNEDGGEWLLNVYFFEALAALLIFALLTWLLIARYRLNRFSLYNGDIALVFMFTYGLSQCFFEAIRSDSLYWNSMFSSRLHFVMISQAISAVLAAVALSVLILRYVYRNGVNVYAVFTVVLSAFGFCMIFSQEIRLPFKDESFIKMMIGQGSLVLIIMGLWLLYRQIADVKKRPAVPWLGLTYWKKRRKNHGFTAWQKEAAK